MGKGAELCAVPKRNQPIPSKDEQGEPSEEKITPALRQATRESGEFAGIMLVMLSLT